MQAISPHLQNKMKNKTAQIALITILTSIMSYTIAHACSIVVPTIRVKCSNLETSILAHIGQTTDEAIKNLHAVIPSCKEDLTSVIDAFEEEIIKWFGFKNRRILLDRDLILEPYSIDRETKIQKNNNNLLSCGYEESKHIGNWLIVFETGRPYCYASWHTSGLCPNIVLSLRHFLFYLVTNFSLRTLPYLAGLALVGGTIIYVWLVLLKNQPVMKLWKIIVLTVVILAIELFLTVMRFSNLGQIIGWILFFYILALWYKKLKSKELASSQTPG